MPFRFFQRFRIASGLRLNVSKGGVSVSAGPRGAQFTLGTSGTRATAGLPGTGLHYTVLNPHKKLVGRARAGQRNAASETAGSAEDDRVADTPVVPRAPKIPKLSWLQRLAMSADAKAFIEGWQAWGQGDVERALVHFCSVPVVAKASADASWSAAILQAQRDQLQAAISSLRQALEAPQHLGRCFAEHGFTPRVQVPVTPEVVATMLPTSASASLLLAELQQSVGDHEAALETLSQTIFAQGQKQIEDVDPVMLAALGELALDANANDALQRFNVLAAEIVNDSPVHTAVMYYRSQFLFGQQLFEAALSVLTLALRKTKHRDPELLRDIRFLRAKTYQALNRRALARRDLERIYAEDPGYEGITQVLGLG